MSRLEKVTLLVSRRYHHGGDGLENEGLRYFRSMEEYQQEATKHGWNKGQSFKSSWCTKPEEIEAMVEHEALTQFKNGQPLAMDKVFFASTEVSTVHHLGGWQR